MTKNERRAYDRKWYAKNFDRLRESKNKRIRDAKKRNGLYVFQYLKNHPCVDCGESDPIVLEFDHQHSKERNVSDLLRGSYSLKKVILEIDKCEVRCANCHRRKTAKQFNWYQYRNEEA
jgi:hypothetical protein